MLTTKHVILLQCCFIASWGSITTGSPDRTHSHVWFRFYTRWAVLDVCSLFPVVVARITDFLRIPVRTRGWKKMTVGVWRQPLLSGKAPKNKVKYYNKLTMLFSGPRGYIQTAVRPLILMIRDPMAPPWLHHRLQSLFFNPPFKRHTSDILFVVFSKVYLYKSRLLHL